MALKESQKVGVLWSEDIDWIILPLVFNLVQQHQNRDGGWGDFPFAKNPESTLASTASLTYLLLQYSPTPNGEAVRKGLRYIRERYDELKSNAHLPMREMVRTGITLLESGEDWIMEEIQEEVQSLLSSYKEDTYGWSYAPSDAPDLRATHSVCRLLLAYRQRSHSQDERNGSNRD